MPKRYCGARAKFSRRILSFPNSPTRPDEKSEKAISREHAEREGAMLVTSDHAFLRKTADSRWRKHIIALRDFAARQKE